MLIKKLKDVSFEQAKLESEEAIKIFSLCDPKIIFDSPSLTRVTLLNENGGELIVWNNAIRVYEISPVDGFVEKGEPMPYVVLKRVDFNCYFLEYQYLKKAFFVRALLDLY